LTAASQEWNERVDIEPLPTHERSCFVSGHDFSRAAQQPSTMGFSPCSYLEHILFIRSVPEFPTSPLLTGATYVVLPKENHMQLAEATSLNRKSREAERLQFCGPFLGMLFSTGCSVVEKSAVSCRFSHALGENQSLALAWLFSPHRLRQG
jgi:hypothetical protein